MQQDSTLYLDYEWDRRRRLTGIIAPTIGAIILLNGVLFVTFSGLAYTVPNFSFGQTFTPLLLGISGFLALSALLMGGATCWCGMAWSTRRRG